MRAETEPTETIVWDRVVRIFHWSTVTLYLLSYMFTEERDLHKLCGYALMIFLCIRLIWGIIGSRHARFSDFVPSPKKFIQYIQLMFQRKEPRHLGHNPAGGAMIVALLLVLAGIGISGWMMSLDKYWGEDWVEEMHTTFVDGSIGLIFLHVGGVIFSSLRHKENLIRSMINGKKHN